LNVGFGAVLDRGKDRMREKGTKKDIRLVGLLLCFRAVYILNKK